MILFVFLDNDQSDCDSCTLYVIRRKIFENRVKVNGVLGFISEGDTWTDLAKESLLVSHAKSIMFL